MVEGPKSSGFEIVLTPGERFQNWLARQGLWKPVRIRDFHHPEPPAGLWSMVNGIVALCAFAILCGILWAAVFRALPALAGVPST